MLFIACQGGRYQFAPDLPPATKLSLYIGNERPLNSFELPSSGCWERNIDVFASGTVQGRVLDSAGNPIGSASVYIISVSTNPLPRWQDLYRENQSKEGFFKFIHIPPGEYLVLVNPDDSLDVEFPYRRTFHPGVHDRSAARVINVRAGEQIKDADIRLEKQFELRSISIRTAWADGGTIRSFVYIKAKGTGNLRLESSASTDAREPIGILKILPNEAYEIQAKLTCMYSDARSSGPGAVFRSPKVYLSPDDPKTELTLTIPATACPTLAGKILENEQ